MRSWRNLSAEEKASLAARFLGGENVDSLAAAFGIGRVESLARTLRYLRAKGRLDELAGMAGDDAAADGDQADSDGDDNGGTTYLEEWAEHVGRLGQRPQWRELVAHARRGAEIQAAYRPDIRRATRCIVSGRPIFLTFMSDFHLGSPHTDYRAFVETTDLIIGDERFYIAVVGPDLETAFAWFRSAEAILNQTIPPWLQIELYRQWLDEMLPRTVAVCGDNHTDERLERVLGDIGLVWRDDVPYFRAWGILTLRVGETDYEIVMSHRYRGHSIYHNLQPALRMMRDIYPVADIYVTAHTHRPAYLCGVFYPEARPLKPRQHFIVAGTFKTDGDIYLLRNFGNSGVLGLPTLALWPSEHRIVHFASPAEALAAMGES